MRGNVFQYEAINNEIIGQYSYLIRSQG
jgi:hypothetical protein